MSLQSCADLVAEGDPARFRALMTLPLELREKLLPVLAFNLEIARAPYVTAEPMIARIRLQWWRDCLDEVYAGGEVRRHEVATPLAEVVRDLDLERAHFDQLIDARETDIEGFDFQTWDALWDYLEKSGGSLLATLAGAARVDGPALRVGTGFAAASWLRAVPDLAARGGQVLPQDDGLREFVDRAFDNLNGAGVLRPITRFGYLAPAILKRAYANPKRVMSGELEPSPLRAQYAFLQSLWV